MAVSILDKTDFRVKKITKNKEMLYQGLIHQKKKKKGNSKCVCIKKQSCKLCGAKADGTEGRN